MSDKQTILYVDDEPENLLLFEINMVDHFTVLTAKSGEIGLEILDQNPQISLIFSDMKMLKMNGLEFISLAKVKRPDIPCFIITGFDITDEISEALTNKTIVNYFRKPYKPKILLEKIAEYIKPL
jgi:two-component system response regulator (stage 0 sporulation protein F)